MRLGTDEEGIGGGRVEFRSGEDEGEFDSSSEEDE